jgi:hypothetical protein
MDLTSAICGLQQAKTTATVQIRIAKKMLEMQEFQGEAAVQLIDAAGKIGSQAGDALAAVATGLGGALDTYG